MSQIIAFIESHQAFFEGLATGITVWWSKEAPRIPGAVRDTWAFLKANGGIPGIVQIIFPKKQKPTETKT